MPADRLVWGSDFGSGLPDQIKYRLNLIRQAVLPPGLLDRVPGANALRLANLTT